MSSYNELLALIDAYINQNGVQAITGQVLNGVLRAMVDQLGRGYAIMGAALPNTDPGTPDAPESWFASTPGTYTNFDGLTVANAELALLSYSPTDQAWTKQTLTQGIVSTSASVDNNVGTPSVTSSYVNGVLTFTFQNLKGNPGQDGDAAGFGTVSATVDGNVGTPGVSVQTSGPNTAKNMVFQFTNLKGETGVTSVVATVDNTSGSPQCAVSLSGGVLTLAFTGLKGAQGDTGSSVAYPFTIVNNLTTNDATQALSAAMGVQLESEVTQLEAQVEEIDEDVTNIEGELSYLPLKVYSNTFLLGRSISTDGLISNTPTSALTSFLDVRENSVLLFPDPKDANNIQLRFLIAEYNDNKTFLRRSGILNNTRFVVDGTTKYIRIMFARASSTGVTMTQTDIDTYFDGKIYNSELYTYEKIQELLPLLNKQIWFDAKKEEIEWTLGKSIDTTGNVTNLSTSAISEFLPVFADEIFTLHSATDTSDITISPYICEYDSDKSFIRRLSSVNGDTTCIVDGTTKYIRLMFSRASSTGIAMTQADIDTYFDGEIWQVGRRIQNGLNQVSSKKDFDAYDYKSTWTLQGTIQNNGQISGATTYAYSALTPRGGLVGLKTLALQDSASRDFITYVVLYDKYERFLGRFSGVVVFSPEVAYFRIVFGRASSTGIAPTQGTIDTYFAIDEVLPYYVNSGKAPSWDRAKNYGVLNCIMRAKQLTWLEYKTKNILPNQVSDIPANTTIIGAPYSSARYYDKFIGLNVSIHTFMTAINNPNSVVYSETLSTPNAKTYYGTVCSSFTAYSLNSPVREVTKKILDNETDYKTIDIQAIELGDICVNDGHIILISGIERDMYGRIINVVTLESIPPKCALTSYSWEQFVKEVEDKSYRCASYNNIGSVPYVKNKYVALMDEDVENITYSPICTNYGDAPLMRKDESIRIDVLNSTGATGIKVYKDDVLFGEYGVSSVTLNNLDSGHYVAQLMNGGSILGVTSWDVCYAEVSKAGTRVSFGDFENCEPLYISFNDATGSAFYCIELTEEDIRNGYVDTDYSGTGVNWLKIYVANGDSSTSFGITL